MDLTLEIHQAPSPSIELTQAAPPTLTLVGDSLRLEVTGREHRIVEIASEPGRIIEIITAGPQGPRGLPGMGGGGSSGGSAFSDPYPAAQILGGHRMLILNAAGNFDYASNADQAHAGRIVGMTTGSALAGDPVLAQTSGEISEPSWNWALDQPVYLGANGLLTQVPPTAPGAKFLVVIGFPVTAHSLFIRIGNPITII